MFVACKVKGEGVDNDSNGNNDDEDNYESGIR